MNRSGEDKLTKSDKSIYNLENRRREDVTMKLKKGITAAAAVCLLVGNVMNVSAAEPISNKSVSALIENRQDNLIIDVEAYKAAYPDLAKAFGDDAYAYLNHYLTVGVYEGRTKGVLFDPLAYAESYGDVKAAFGYDIASIVEHYVNHGITENRMQGTAYGYNDIASAKRAGAVVQNPSVLKSTAGRVTASRTDEANSAHVYNSASDNGTHSGSDSSAAVNNSANSYNTSETGNNLQSSSATASVSPVKDYHHTTSIYDNDEKTLLRVEYYDDNNQLIKYSSVTNFDSNTNSYTENIYHYDESTNSSVLERTDKYENGSLSSSVTQ